MKCACKNKKQNSNPFICEPWRIHKWEEREENVVHYSLLQGSRMKMSDPNLGGKDFGGKCLQISRQFER